MDSVIKGKIMYAKYILTIIILCISSLYAQDTTITATFTGDTYDTTAWFRYNQDVADKWSFTSNTMQCNVTYTGIPQDAWEYDMFLSKKISTSSSNLDINCQMYYSTGNYRKQPFLVLYSDTDNYMVMYADSNTSNHTYMLIKIGGNTVYYTSFTSSIWTSGFKDYRITYDRSTDEVKFYEYTAGWNQKGTTQVVDFSDLRFYGGVACNINYGFNIAYYDNLSLTYTPQPETYINILSPTEGDIYVPGDTVNISWEASDSNVTIDTPIDVLITDTIAYSWAIPDTFEVSTLKILLYLTDTLSIRDSLNITLLNSKFLEIDSVYPSYIAPGTGNDSLYIKTNSNSITNIKYFYKINSSSDWTFFGQDSVTAITGVDTNVFAWWITAKETDSLYLKVEEDADTSLYSFSNPGIVELGTYHAGGVCYAYKGDQPPFSRKIKKDVSCGWVGNISWDIGDFILSDNGSTGLSFQTVSPENKQAVWGATRELVTYIQVDGGGITEVSRYYGLITYNLYQYTSGFTWRGYRYTFQNNIIYVTDLVHGIPAQIYVDLSSYTQSSSRWTTPYFSSNPDLALYNFPSTTLVGGSSDPLILTTPVTEDWIVTQHKIYNFTPFLVVYTSTGIGGGRLLKLNIAGDAYSKTDSPLSDTAILSSTGSVIKRYYFRGIKPRANRHQNYPYNLLGR